MKPWSLVRAALVLGALAGCTNPLFVPDGGTDARVDAMDAALNCSSPQVACSGRCVDTRADPANCGACGMACAAGLVCTNGTCAPNCATGQLNCSGRCVSAQTDNANCGACGTACPAGQLCSAGRCGVSCATGFATCGGDAGAPTVCADLQTDNAHCGACGTTCPAGTRCASGTCQVSCVTGQSVCNGACVNLQSDVSNCGACGMACAAGQVCSMGACAASCGTGLTNCGGSCVATATDPTHCGNCATSCALSNVSTQACASGSCAVGACAAGFGDCDGMAANGCETNTRGTDVNNCGGCGIRCAFANAGATCNMGVCSLGTCNTGFGDCDGMAANGCETNTQSDNANCGACSTSGASRACASGQVCSSGTCGATCGAGTMNCSGDCVRTASDPANCGGCGRACNLANVSVQACAMSACVVSACATGFGDCDGMAANGCETNTRGTDVNNCGGCGIRCAFANAGATCTAGVCGMGTCAAGFADCDGNAANGCETNTQTDNANCGACSTSGASRACASGQVCSSGTCGATCGAGTMNCSGDCVRTTNDPANCGGCARACSLTNVSVQACAASTCVVGACATGFGDCDGMAANGCETNTRGTDVNNCGACGSRCAFANAGASCSTGACVMGACNAGFADCDGNPANGCEVNTNGDSNNCGGCGMACPSGQLCGGGTCGATCGAGTVPCSGACVNSSNDPANCGGCGTSCNLANVRVQACAASTCVVGACSMGFADCDANPATGCEVNVLGTDANNCGACGARCSFANAAASCSTGACVMGACNAGFADCDGNPANGCEVNLNTDSLHCGTCAMVCGAGTMCSSGSCASSCGGGTTLCGAACAALTVDPNNCGACNNVCGPYANAAAACLSSACRQFCNSGFGDCDGSTSNGCEINLNTDTSNCGACGRACATSGANVMTGSCTAGLCGLVCNTNFGNCDANPVNGCESNLQTDVNNCGACGNACLTGQTCSAGSCHGYGYGPLTTLGTFLNACTTAGSTIITTTGDDAVTMAPIGFSFSYWGTSFTSFFADTNGNLILAASATSALSNTCPLTGARLNMIAPLWDDMNLGRSGATGVHRICTVAVGTAPSRQWIVTYEEVPFFSTLAVTLPATFSAIMNESDSSIDFQWRTNCARTSGTVGLVGGTATQLVQFSTCNSGTNLDGNQLHWTYRP